MGVLPLIGFGLSIPRVDKESENYGVTILQSRTWNFITTLNKFKILTSYLPTSLACLTSDNNNTNNTNNTNNNNNHNNGMAGIPPTTFPLMIDTNNLISIR